RVRAGLRERPTAADTEPRYPPALHDPDHGVDGELLRRRSHGDRAGAARRRGGAGRRGRRGPRAASRGPARAGQLECSRGDARGGGIMTTTRPVASGEAGDALWTLLETAQNVAGELRKDGLLDLLGNVLACMLPEDRDAVLQILEHDAGGRTQVGDHLRARFVLRPNPFAQIYARPPTPSRAPDVCYLESRRAA